MLRLYADTSVFGGFFDPEFQDSSRRLFTEVKSGRFRVVLSPTTLRELAFAPERVRNLLAELPDQAVEVLAVSEQAESLREAYLEAGVLSLGSQADAEHIAYASVAGVDLIVSWNFKHIVHFDKIRGFHAVNMLRGYAQIPIHSPPEIIET
ncbi:MAG: PIN domain-containing protein [Phycisphaerales bacterium]|nr:PIN domain-containing protein [Phycisphaerales bacterium]